MRFLHEIEKLNEEQLRKIIARKIEKLERKSKKNNPTAKSIGYQVGEQPETNEVHWEGDDLLIKFYIRCFYNQFIPKDMKIVYGMAWNTENGKGNNHGSFYYMDNQEYLYDFCKWIQDKEIQDEYELFGYIRDFLKKYFGKIRTIDRDQMHKLLIGLDGNCFEPTKGHSIGDFKGKGNALCSEYAVMAQNILRLFDYESYLVIGNVIMSDKQPESHAYNLLTFKESATGEWKHAVVDFINGVNMYDINFKKIEEEPFMGFIDSLDQDFVNRLVQGDERLRFEEYGFSKMGDTLLKLTFGNKTRVYYIDKLIRAEESVNCSKTYTYKRNPMI